MPVYAGGERLLANITTVGADAKFCGRDNTAGVMVDDDTPHILLTAVGHKGRTLPVAEKRGRWVVTVCV